MAQRGSWLLVTVLGVALLGGCTTTSTGDPGPAPTTSSESGSPDPSSTPEGPEDLPSDGAPKVTDPFEADRFEQDPCLALTEDQAQELNIGYPGDPYKGVLGNACDWRGRDASGGRAAIDFLSEEPRGMSSLYRSNGKGEFAFFEPLDPVAGHPLTAFGVDDLRESTGECAVAVGLTDELVFTVFLNLSRGNVGHKDPCVIGTQVAEMMLTTMGAS